MIIDVQSRAQLPEDVAAASLAPIAVSPLSLTHYMSLMSRISPSPACSPRCQLILSCCKLLDMLRLTELMGSGVFLMQSFTYWKYQNGDKLWTKAIVVFTTVFAIGFTCYVWVSQLHSTSRCNELTSSGSLVSFSSRTLESMHLSLVPSKSKVWKRLSAS